MSEFSNDNCHYHNYHCAECEDCISDEQFDADPEWPVCCHCEAEADPT